jgi:hypothetical protein
MHPNVPLAGYVVATRVIVRAAFGLFAQALRRPGALLVLGRDGRVLPR